jgi:ADP-heptose:LPS heptosyltransferase
VSGAIHQLQTTNEGPTPVPEPSRIAIFQALNLGDLLCTTPALRAIRRRYPHAEITMIGGDWARALVGRLPFVDRFFPFPGFPGIAESPADAPRPGVQGPACDLAIQMHGSGKESNGYVASLRAPSSLGYGPPGESRLTSALPWKEHEPEPLRWLRLVAALGARADHTRLDMPITTAEAEKAAALIDSARGAPLVGMHVGSSLPNRRWPAEAFAGLADWLIDQLGARIVLTGTEPEKPLTAAVQAAMRGSTVDLAGRTTIGEYAAVIAALDLLVTNDTSASHIAAATQTRSIVLFGPTRPERWAPLDLTLHHIVDAAAHAGPGMDGSQALRELSPEFVAVRCMGALREAQATSRLGMGRIA